MMMIASINSNTIAIISAPALYERAVECVVRRRVSYIHPRIRLENFPDKLRFLALQRFHSTLQAFHFLAK